MSGKELSKKVEELKSLKIMADELQAEITAIEDEIKREMEARDTQEMVVGIFKIRYTAVKSNRFDTKAFKQTHAELYNQYLKETMCRRFSIA